MLVPNRRRMNGAAAIGALAAIAVISLATSARRRLIVRVPLLRAYLA
jgi:hypothetical protein